MGNEDGKRRHEEKMTKGVWKKTKKGRRDEKMRGKGVGERKGK